MIDDSEADFGKSAPHLCEYAADVTAERLDKMLTYIEGVRAAEEIESVHQMRVWSRRTRAAIEIFQVCFTGRAFETVEKEVKAATDALSEARDLDVMIENLAARCTKLPVRQRAGIQSFIERLRGQRSNRQAGVRKAIDNLEQHGLAQKFHNLAHQLAADRAERAMETAGECTDREDTRPKLRRRGKKGGRRG